MKEVNVTYFLSDKDVEKVGEVAERLGVSINSDSVFNAVFSMVVQSGWHSEFCAQCDYYLRKDAFLV